MEFKEILNSYISQIHCTAKELAEATGLSPTTLSRYRSGERMPDYEQMKKIIDGIVAMAGCKGIKDIYRKNVEDSFEEFLKSASFDYEQFSKNLNVLMTNLNISVSELARALKFDASYLSKIRSGQRRPSDRDGFIAGVCSYVVRTKSWETIADLIGCDEKNISSESACFSELCKWLSSGVAENYDYMSEFLQKLDDFDLDEYIRTIHFDELKVPSVPFQLPKSKVYYGTEEMKQGELDFFKCTVLSKSKEPVFMCSDMPMADMAEDLEFGKKWMFAIAMSLKKGLHLNIIHSVDRPFKEMLLGLESWLPIYMTGQVSPYYLKGKHNSVYCHFNYVSGKAALCGECIQGFHNEGRYILTTNKDDVAYYKKKSERLIEKAYPLMEIYRSNSKSGYDAFLRVNAQTEGVRHNILSSLPIYTIPENVLNGILERNNISVSDSKKIIEYSKKQKVLTDTILKNNPVIDDVSVLSREEFDKHPATLSLSGLFYEKDISYTYEEYEKHLEATRQFEKANLNYVLQSDSLHAFRNIQIRIHEGKWAMISKNKAPAIHFVIRHTKMLNALQNFIVPVVEE